MKRRAAAALTLLVLLGAATILLPVKDWLREALFWTDAHREVSWLAYIGLYAVATVCLVPGLFLTLGAGAIFGLSRGIVLASAGSVAGATAAFFVGRTFAREWISARIETWPKFRALDRALGARGFWIVLLTRLTPAFPFNLLNYAYGVSAVRPRDYILGSWIGMFPLTAVIAYAGSAAASLGEALSGGFQTGTSGWVLLGAGFAATLAVAILVTIIARRQLERELQK